MYIKMTKEELLKQNKALFWDIVDLKKLDDYAIEERFFMYGNWKNILAMKKVFWVEKLRKDYVYLRDKKRTNLSKKTINFFNLYFDV